MKFYRQKTDFSTMYSLKIGQREIMLGTINMGAAITDAEDYGVENVNDRLGNRNIKVNPDGTISPADPSKSSRYTTGSLDPETNVPGALRLLRAICLSCGMVRDIPETAFEDRSEQGNE